MHEDRPVVYTIIAENDDQFRIYTKDSRLVAKDSEIEHIHISKLFNTMVMISTILNDEGYAVLFEVD